MFSLRLKDLISDFIFDFTAAGVVPCGGRETSPRTSTIVQFIFYFGPLRSSVGNHVIFVTIHCTERWRRFAPDRILSKGKQHFLSVFSIFI